MLDYKWSARIAERLFIEGLFFIFVDSV